MWYHTVVMSRNNAIDFWRIIFTYLIMLFHFNTTFPWMQEVGLVPGWYLGVEFFFLVSGYLIYARMEENEKRYGGAIGYTIHRYRTIYPEYIVTFAMTFFAIHILGKSDLSIPRHLYESIPEIILMQSIGIDRGWEWVNSVMWYLSAMIIAGFLMYLGLRYIRRFFVGYLAPAVIILFIFLLYENVRKLDVAVMLPGEYANYPLYRGIAEMFLGMYACMLTGAIQRLSLERYADVVGRLSMVAAICISSVRGKTRADFAVLALLFIGVATQFLPGTHIDIKLPGIKRDVSARLIKKWSSITMEMYLLHELFRTHIFPYFFSRDVEIGRKLFYMLLYVNAVTAAAAVMHMVFNMPKARRKDTSYS